MNFSPLNQGAVNALAVAGPVSVTVDAAASAWIEGGGRVLRRQEIAQEVSAGATDGKVLARSVVSSQGVADATITVRTRHMVRAPQTVSGYAEAVIAARVLPRANVRSVVSGVASAYGFGSCRAFRRSVLIGDASAGIASTPGARTRQPMAVTATVATTAPYESVRPMVLIRPATSCGPILRPTRC